MGAGTAAPGEAGTIVPMQISQLRQRLRALGANAAHEARVLRHWALAKPQDSGRRRNQHYLPQALREALPDIEAELAGLTRLHSVHPGEDGSERLLLTLADSLLAESVLLPRDGLCISSQIGCAVGCRFCMTGRDGLQRQLSSGEMVAQVVLARSRRPVKKVVFMGMGEPAHNLDAVLEAIQLLGHEGGIGHKQLVFSTVGDERAFDTLIALGEGQAKPALALSLHTTKPELREQLLPRAPRIAPAELVARAEAYARATGYPVQYQWTLLDGVNDGPDEIEGIVALLSGTYGVLNMIPYNQVDGLPYQRPSWEKAAEIARTLHRRGILTKLRQSAGQDVDGGCGQLRARVLAPHRRGEVVPIQVVAQEAIGSAAPGRAGP